MYPLELYFGGTFNPIHHGHLQVALEISEQLSANTVYLLPNYLPPHKASPDVSADHRAKMCQLACQIDNKFKLDSRELNSNGTSYTIATLKQLRSEKPDISLCFLIGMDSLQTLDTWREWQSLTDHAHLVVAARGGYQAEFNADIKAFLQQHQTLNYQDLSQQKSGLVYLTQTSELMISASQIRARYQNKQNCLCLLPSAVNEYIMHNHLYQR
ncbi:nicotinate-nucleotide adenylyltransferase [Catenovulum sp. 2E275]|uniref:nicotinate-nucleotide adenylyltransferase n=1 Tax=Catenovulum sp. 2E275 TaxID=2980497 RepID=UPI0021CFCD42|nr:nicotinate-nucleotide adenylyltransferase [Catenovulum sp. 2E275]MCU4675436.1 nicotinate-nucleotide adenylyltransferase [Catenovulum sp. 2E275]